DDPRQGGGLAEVAETERDPVQEQTEELSRGSGTASSKHEYVVEDAQHIGKTEEEDEEQQRPEVVELDVAELAPRARAVELCGLNGLGGNGLEPREHDEVDE